MCPTLVDDIMRVVIDRRDDKSASVGRFELAYRGTPVPTAIAAPRDLAVVGSTTKRCA